MKILIDMNLSPSWKDFLVGLAYAPDPEIMEYAVRHDYVVLTHDLDFSAILAATNVERPSVIQLRSTDIELQVIGNLTVNAIRQTVRELDDGALVTVDLRRTRLRILR